MIPASYFFPFFSLLSHDDCRLVCTYLVQHLFIPLSSRRNCFSFIRSRQSVVVLPDPRIRFRVCTQLKQLHENICCSQECEKKHTAYPVQVSTFHVAKRRWKWKGNSICRSEKQSRWQSLGRYSDDNGSHVVSSPFVSVFPFDSKRYSVTYQNKRSSAQAGETKIRARLYLSAIFSAGIACI